jgi:predicted membrane protein
MSSYIKKYLANILAGLSAVILVGLFIPFLMGTLFSNNLTLASVGPIWLIIFVCFAFIFNFYFSNLKYVKTTMILLILILIPYGFLFYMHASVLLYANTLAYKSEAQISSSKEETVLKSDQAKIKEMYLNDKTKILYTPDLYKSVKSKNDCVITFTDTTQKVQDFYVAMVTKYDEDTNSNNMKATKIKSVKLSSVFYNDTMCVGMYILDLGIGGEGWDMTYNRHQELLLDKDFKFVASYAVDNDDFLLRRIDKNNQETALSLDKYKSEIDSLFATSSVYVISNK